MQAFFRHLALAFALALAPGAQAQELSALARVDAAQSTISDGWFGKTSIALTLSQGVPFRLFTLDGPPRLVLDFKEVDWSGVVPEDLLAEPGKIAAVRFGAYRPGWSRLVADLSAPMLPLEVAMPLDAATGAARLEVTLEEVPAEDFAARAGSNQQDSWEEALAPQVIEPKGKETFTVVLDPGHGGIDPGAENGGVAEKDLMLSIARSLQEELRRNGVTALLTRDDDYFVALEHRVAIAHQTEADLFVSLHADNLSQGGARGAVVYVLSEEASDAASAHLAARHNRADIIAGVDLSGSDDEVARVLLDLARQETGPRSVALAETLVADMKAAGGPMNRRALRSAGFSVLKSADIPSVLIEVGFLSSKRDLANLRDPVWRAGMVQAISNGILRWRDEDAARAALLRQ